MLEQVTEQTATSIEELHQLLCKEQERGYTLSMSAFEAGVVSVGAAVRDSSGEIVAAINITGLETVLDREALEGEIKDRVVAATEAISKLMGYRG